MSLSAYNWWIEKELSGIEVKQVVILVSSEKNTRMEFVKRTEEYKDLLTQRLNQFYETIEWNFKSWLMQIPMIQWNKKRGFENI